MVFGTVVFGTVLFVTGLFVTVVFGTVFDPAALGEVVLGGGVPEVPGAVVTGRSGNGAPVSVAPGVTG